MAPSDDIDESTKHKRYIELLAEETMQPVEKVEPIYDGVLNELVQRAEIADFVPVFAWRKARALLTQR